MDFSQLSPRPISEEGSFFFFFFCLSHDHLARYPQKCMDEKFKKREWFLEKVKEKENS